MSDADLLARQRAFFESGATRPLAFRKKALNELHAALKKHEAHIADALKADLNKHPLESYMSEIGMVINEIHFHLKHLRKWAKQKPVRTTMGQFPAKGVLSPEPYGVVLIISPWNYPLLLCMLPLVGAISAGNCALVKLSRMAAATSAAIKNLIEEVFDPGHVAVVKGAHTPDDDLLQEQFDYIFFTGSEPVGKQVMVAAARHLTPVTLELGGKSPVIVDETADIQLAAKKIAFGKTLNGGQTCIAPDYLLVHASIKTQFIEAYRAAILEFFPGGDFSNMPVIINERHFVRLIGLMEGQSVVVGGNVDATRRFIEPTLLDDVAPSAPIMQEEVFGPILPMLLYTDLGDCIRFIRERPKPLALYLFTRSEAAEERVLNTCSFGGGCINDTVIHLATPHMPFGGVGSSGMGSYHGKKSFDTFTHYRGIIKKSSWIDPSMRYHPYTPGKFSAIRKLLK